MDKSSHTYDVVIIGGGIAGCATAIALQKLKPSLQIAIIERNTIHSSATVFRIGETLPPQSSSLLNTLGLWDDFLNCNFIRSYGTAAAWGSATLRHNEYLFSTAGYGWHLDRATFDQFMYLQATRRGITFIEDTTILNSNYTNDQWHLHCNRERKLTARFVVDATGKKAVFASQQHIQKIKDDHLVGIHRFFRINTATTPLGKGTCVETDIHGWWYSATLPNQTLVVSYMTDADIANRFLYKKSIFFNTALENTKYTSQRISNASPLTPIKLVAAHTQRLSSCIGKNWLAVGDALSSYDPISSLGIYKALHSSIYASYAIIDHFKGDSIGLQKYKQLHQLLFDNYLQKRHAYYKEEQRFVEAPFWKRRQFDQTTISNHKKTLIHEL
ncbi:NAD(P)/FAD-dependent oxidoreductase [Aquimarina rhabdastrellae]